MAMPTGIAIVDTMMGLPAGDPKRWYDFLQRALHDQESKGFEFPAQYMFKDVPKFEIPDDPARFLLDNMDRFGIRTAMIGVNFQHEPALRALKEFPDRFVGSYEIDPNRGMDGVRELQRAVEEIGVKAATFFPAGTLPQVAINDKKAYPYYAKCVELDIPIFCCAGVPGPRVPMQCQYVGHIDEVCYDFPELVFVTRHGCEPWADLAVKLMLKWPNLHYSTSAFAPKHYPPDVVKYANTRGADKVIYGGYFPMGLTLDRIFHDMIDVPFRDHVWPKFLHDNAARVLKLDA